VTARYPLSIVCGGVLLALAPNARAFDFYEHEYIGEVVCRVMSELREDELVTSSGSRDRGTSDDGTGGDVSCGHLSPVQIALAGDHAATPEALASVFDDQLRRQRKRQRAEVYGWLANHDTAWQEMIDDDVNVLTEAIGTHKHAADQLSAIAEAVNGVGRTQLHLFVTPAAATPADSVATPSEQDRELQRLSDAETAQFFEKLSKERAACFSPPKELEDGFANLAGYVQLARKNYTHFGWDALLSHFDAQKRAMGQTGDEQMRSLAFALHFMTDLYAAGHLRVERRELNDLDSKLQHDWDNRNGLFVAQRFFVATSGSTLVTVDAVWRSYGDRCLLSQAARANRLLSEWVAYRIVKETISGHSEVHWSRPISLPPFDDDTSLRDVAFNDPKDVDFREHFNLRLALGSLIPLSRADRSFNSATRAAIGYEYYPPLWQRIFFESQLKFEASRFISLIPIGGGVHESSFFFTLGPALRWSTAARFFAVGGQVSAGWSWMPFPPVEVRLRVASTPYHVWSTSAPPILNADRYQIEAFAEMVFRVDR
jgi:hypothetical protein